MMRPNRGFTLVEVLLALSLMSMLLALAYGGMRASTRAADKGQSILEDSSRIRMAHQFVRKQVNQMAPLGFAEGDTPESRIVFEGDINKIRFVASMPGYLGFGGPQVQELEIISGENGRSLVLSHALLQNFEEGDLYLRDPIVLVDKIESAEFSFLGLDETGAVSGWASQWEATGILPEAVSLDIEFIEGVYIQWPLLVASVRIDPTAFENQPGSGVTDGSYQSAVRDMMKKGNKQ